MQRLPASVAASTVVHRRPFAFAHNRQSRAVDDAMEGSARWDAGGMQPRETDCVGRAWWESGAARSTPINDKTDRQTPSAWRTGATRPWRRQRAPASRPLAGPRPARTLTHAPRDPSSCTSDGPLISCRDHAPAAVTVAREPTAASSQPEGLCTNAKELERRGHCFCRYADDGVPRRHREETGM